MVRTAALAGLATLLLSGCAAEADSAPLAGPPAPALELTGRVVDAADVLSPEFEAGLASKLGNLEERTLVQLVVATTPDLQNREIDDYSLDLANAWGLGNAERNDGLLLLVAPNERKVRIEFGLGLEASVNDEEAGRIIREDILPKFRSEDFEGGINAGVDNLISEVTSFELKEAA
ncbi:MAG: TPM domain-containing protein [Erythrobacter sp.]|uniref:TPM domain-containing protein n=1 Tax=Erythrobacter sp. TaxID=1042 RepID=UPI003297DAE3